MAAGTVVAMPACACTARGGGGGGGEAVEVKVWCLALAELPCMDARQVIGELQQVWWQVVWLAPAGGAKRGGFGEG